MDASYPPTLLEENWLSLALTHVVTQWLSRSLQDLLPPLMAGKISCEVFAAEIDAALQSRNLFTLSGQKNPRSNVAQALKSIAPNYPAIALVSLAPDRYRILKDAQLGKLGDKKRTRRWGERVTRGTALPSPCQGGNTQGLQAPLNSLIQWLLIRWGYKLH